MFKSLLPASLNSRISNFNLPHQFSYQIVWPLIFLITGALWFHWRIIQSGFDLVYGDYGDNRLSMMLMEHWYNYFLGNVSFRNPIFFFPAKDVLGFTDSYFLFSLPYALGRTIGLTEYGAFQSVVIIFNIFAFFSMYWLLRCVLSLDVLISNIFATMFAFPNVIAVNMGHMQFLSIALLPLLSGILFRFVTVLKMHPNLGFLYGVAFSIIFPLLAYTSFYTAWFYALYLLIILLIFILIICWQRKWEFFIDVLNVVSNSRYVLLSITMFGMLASVPFLITYGPQYLQRGGFVPDELFISTLPHPVDLINVGSTNLVWGGLLKQLIPNMSNRLSAYELNMGFPILFASILLIGTVTSGIYWLKGAASKVLDVSYVGLTFLLGFTVLLCLSFIINWYNGVSLWWFIRAIVPGAKAIRVVSRFQLILIFPASVAVAMFLSYVKSNYINIIHNDWHKWLSLALFTLLMIFLFAEQSSPVYATVSKGEELEKFSRIMAPPSSCKVFALSRVEPSGGRNGKILSGTEEAIVRRSQVDAIYLAYKYKIPTVNGLSSLNPLEYWMFNIMSPFYTVEVGEWLARHELYAGICTFNIATNKWMIIDPNFLKIPIGKNLLDPDTDKPLSDSMGFSMKGFSGAGFGQNAWTSGDSEIKFTVPAHIASINLKFYVVNPKGSNVGIMINGHEVHSERYQGGTHMLTLAINKLLYSIEIKSNTFVPNELNKKSIDSRKLGILLTDFRVNKV